MDPTHPTLWSHRTGYAGRFGLYSGGQITTHYVQFVSFWSLAFNYIFSTLIFSWGIQFVETHLERVIRLSIRDLKFKCNLILPTPNNHIQ